MKPFGRVRARVNICKYKTLFRCKTRSPAPSRPSGLLMQILPYLRLFTKRFIWRSPLKLFSRCIKFFITAHFTWSALYSYYIILVLYYTRTFHIRRSLFDILNFRLQKSCTPEIVRIKLTRILCNVCEFCFVDSFCV